MRILVFFLAVLFLVSFPSIASATSVPIPQLTSVLFNGGISPETAQALDLTGANWTSVALTNGSGNIYTALVDVTVSTDGTQVTRHLAVNFIYRPVATPTPSPPLNQTIEVGFNVTGISHYGYPDLLPASRGKDIDTTLAEIQRMGGRVIRVFAANDQISHGEAARRLDALLTKAASYNISVIIALINYYGDNGFRPDGTEGYYTASWNNIPLLGHNFFTGGYKNEYESFVRTVVAANKNHPNIYAWEPGNELKDNESSQTFIQFMSDITAVIKSLDPGHPIASGMLNAGHAGLSPSQLYSQLPNVDIVTIHNYDGSRAGWEDVVWAVGNNKRVIDEETGFSGGGDRSDAFRQAADYWKNQGVTAILQWGFIAKNLSDNGNGDRIYGMDNIWHTDYDQLFSLFSLINGADHAVSSPTPLPTPSPTATVTPTPSNRPTSIPTITPTSSPRASSSPTPAPFNEQEYLSEPELPDENLNFPSLVLSEPEIRVILFGNQPLDPSGQSPLSIHLNGQPGQRSYVLLPVSMSYSQGPTRNLAIQFNYLEESRGTATSRSSTAGGGTNTGAGNTNQPKYDLNSDKIINIVDVEIFFNEWRNKLSGGTILKGDFNGDGVVNSIDYAMLKNQIGKRV